MDIPVTREVAERWIGRADLELPPEVEFGKTTRGQLLDAMHKRAMKLPGERRRALRGDQEVTRDAAAQP